MRILFSALSSTVLAAMLTAPSQAAAPKVLTIGLSQEPDTLHPIISSMSAATDVRITALLPIAAVNEVWRNECFLCTSIPSTENGGAKIIDENGKKKMLVTWEIRQDAKWGDGIPVTGEDMRLAWRIGISPNVVKGSPEAFNGIEDVIVDAKNPKRFTLKYKEIRYDYDQFDYSFVPIPSHIEGPIFEKTKDQVGAYERQTAYITNPTLPGLYNGPYRVKELQVSDHVLLDRNANYFEKPAAFEQVLFKIIQNTQALEANLLAGQIDMTGGTGITFDQALMFRKRLKEDQSLARRFRVETVDDLIYEHITFNLRDPVMADLAVRQALIYSIDRPHLCEALFNGIQRPAAHAFHPLSPYFTKDVADYPYDPAKAMAILEQAGWKKGPDGIRQKNGKRLALTIMTTAQNKVRETVEVHLQEAWKKVGIDLSIKNVPARIFFSESLRKAQYGSMGMFAATLASPADIQIANYHSANIPTAANGWVGKNYTGWNNPEVDRLLSAAKVETDVTKRKALIKGVIEQYVHDLPQLPLYHRVAEMIVPAALNTHNEGGVGYATGLKIGRWTWDDSTAH